MLDIATRRRTPGMCEVERRCARDIDAVLLDVANRCATDQEAADELHISRQTYLTWMRLRGIKLRTIRVGDSATIEQGEEIP